MSKGPRPPKGDVKALIRQYAKPGMHSVDVGANIGEITELLATYGPVTAIEPDPRCWDLIRARVPQAALLTCAVGAGYGPGTLYQAEDTPHSSLSEAAVPDRKTTCAVTIDRLDDCIASADLVKIDAQGAEVAILRGAERLLRTCPTWVLECWPNGLRAHRDDPLDLVRLCETAGLTVRWANGTPCSVEDLRAWWDLDTKKFERHVNVVATR